VDGSRRTIWSAARALALVAAAVVGLPAVATLVSAQSPGPRVAAYSYDLVRQFSRGTDAYTQGLVFHDGRLFEGTGLYGESVLRETVLEDGAQKILRSRPLPDVQSLAKGQRGFLDERLAGMGYSARQVGAYRNQGLVFGEGITVMAGRIYQLTWVEGLCFVWDLASWTRPVRTFQYTGEGWGLTHDGTHLVMSDGSANLTFRDPKTFAVVRTVVVRDPRTGASVPQLNELEYVGGKIYANVYQTRRVAIIDPRSGRLEAYVFFDGRELPTALGRQPSLLPQAAWTQLDARGEVLNGIAHARSAGAFYVTGKKWPAIYEVKLREVAGVL
jgi:glutamine cyclotransferase